MPSPGSTLKPEIPAKPDLKGRRRIQKSEAAPKKTWRTFDGRESTLTPSRPAPPPPPSRKRPIGKTLLVNANGISLKESTQEILAKKQQLLSASLILKAATQSGGSSSSAKPLIPPKPPSSRPLSYIPKEEVLHSSSGDSSKTTLFTSFFNRLSNLRRSFNNSSPSKGQSASYSHQDWRSFFPPDNKSESGSLYNNNNNSYAEIDETLHGRYLTIPKEVPIAPPRRKRPRLPSTLRRSLSLSDAHVIAQAVVEGDGGLIKELYPDFPRYSAQGGEPIYAIVDRSRKKKHRATIQEIMSPYRRHEEAANSDLCPLLHQEEDMSVGAGGRTPFCEEPSQCSTPPAAKRGGQPLLDFYCPKEPPLVISPWNNKGTLIPNLIVEASSSSSNGSAKVPSHPYAQRTVSSHYDKPRSSNNNMVGLRSCDDSFQAILDTADSSILQAESILSNLRIEDEDTPVAEEEEDVSSDIESNIRRLEMTQAKINAALETFRQVQQRRRDDCGKKSSPPVNKEGGHRGGKRQTSQLARTAPPPPEKVIRKGTSHSTLVETSSSPPSGNNMEQQARCRKPGLFRRHSFNLQYNNNSSTTAPTNSNQNHQKEPNNKAPGHSSWYDEESGSHQQDHESGGGGYSDSEGGGIRRRIRGLFGSFGKGGSNSSTTASSSSMFYTSNKPKEEEEDGDFSSDLFSQTVGEFTRRIESLNRPQEEEHHPSSKSICSSSSSSSSSSSCNHQSNSGSYSHLVAANASAASSSHRLSVISNHSCSSSYDESDDEENDEGLKLAAIGSSVSSSGPLEEDEDVGTGRKREKQVFYIAREILTSERVFVDVLHLLTVELKDFIEAKRKSLGKKLLPDGDLYRIFSNLGELYALNKDLLSDFEERIKNWSSSPKIADVIVRKGPFLKLYTSYIREFSDVNAHFDDCLGKYQKFAKVVKEFESRERCRNLKIKHFLLKPVQRLPQYKLLLEDYLKHLDPVSSPDFDDTTNALRIVSEAAEHANDTIRQGDKFRRMLKLQSRLGDQELIRPGRELIKEGELQKISRKGIGPRYFILLSDVLLYASSSNRSDSSSLRVSYSIPLNSLSVRVLPHYETEFSVSSPVRSCTLRAASVSERNDWVEALNGGIEEHRHRQATFFSPQELSGERLDVVGNCAPVWIPDRRVTMCQNCTVEFSVLVRRHHCRACGKVVCASCSGNKAPLRYKGFEVGRVCDECFDSLERELGHVDNLRHRFKKRHSERHPPSSAGGIPLQSSSSHSGRYVPGRLKVRAVGEGAQMSGYLKRRLQKNGKWKRMWYVLKDRVLYAYKASEDTVATDTFPVLGFTLDTLSDKNFELYEGESADLVFQLTHPGSESLIFCAENDNVSEKWITALGEAVKLGPETGNLIEL